MHGPLGCQVSCCVLCVFLVLVFYCFTVFVVTASVWCWCGVGVLCGVWLVSCGVVEGGSCLSLRVYPLVFLWCVLRIFYSVCYPYYTLLVWAV